MKVPTCKLCQRAHWSYENHTGTDPSVPDYVREMAAGAMGYEKRIPVFPDPNPPETVTTVTSDETPVTKRNNVTPVTKVVLGAGGAEFRMKPKGRPKKHKDAAARQRAYRERQSA